MDFDPKHVVYVWLDALTNYITAMGYGSGAVRLPLTPMEESRRAVLLEEMKKLGVLA